MTTARLAAARALVAVERGRTTLAAEVERGRADLDARDRAFLLELVAGTLRWQQELDACLQTVSREPIAALDAGVRATLRAAAYQLRHLERVPAHAIVHESVEVVRQLGHERAAGFVNAVLRSLTRRKTVPLPSRPASARDREAALQYLTVTLSHPDWLVDRWLTRYGFEAAERWCQFNNAPPELAVRAPGGDSAGELIALLEASGATAQPAGFVRAAVRLAPGSLGRLPAEVRARLVVQEEASQLVAHTLGARPGDLVLDLCAAPGGKTALLSADMDRRGLLVASDVRRGRVELLEATLRRLGVAAPVVALDATRGLPFGPVFDRVLLDAPCSGLGVLRRDPDLKWSRRPDDLPAFARAQEQMLGQAAAVVRPGGLLLYATCSSEPEENEQVVERFLNARTDYALIPVVPGPRVDQGERLRDAAGYLRTLPFLHGLDAFFAAALRRKAL
jgi:16S rRNA (cytosine967-C5)-methyltransferase